MTEKQRQRWIALRTHGLVWFVFVYGLLRYALPFGIFAFVGNHLLGTGGHSLKKELIVLAIGSSLFGFCCAAVQWQKQEERFHLDAGGASSA